MTFVYHLWYLRFMTFKSLQIHFTVLTHLFLVTNVSKMLKISAIMIFTLIVWHCQSFWLQIFSACLVWTYRYWFSCCLCWYSMIICHIFNIHQTTVHHTCIYRGSSHWTWGFSQAFSKTVSYHHGEIHWGGDLHQL